MLLSGNVRTSLSYIVVPAEVSERGMQGFADDHHSLSRTVLALYYVYPLDHDRLQAEARWASMVAKIGQDFNSDIH